MADLSLTDFPPEAQAKLKGMSDHDLEMLMIDIRGRQLDDITASYPGDAEAAAKGAREALNREFALNVDEPLDMFVSLFAVVREALAHGSTEDLDRIDCLHLWKLTDIGDDLLRAHVAAFKEANDRLRAFTQPVPASRK